MMDLKSVNCNCPEVLPEDAVSGLGHTVPATEP